MTLAIITPPAAEPVTIADLRAYLRLSGSEEDTLLADLIAAARGHVEQATRRALITQGVRVYLDRWPAGRIVRLPVAPVASVEAVTVYDADGVPNVLDPADWQLDKVSAPARLKVALGAGGGARSLNGIEIDFTAGYGADPESIPAPFRQAIRLLAAHWFEHREAGTELAMASLPHGLDRLLSTYRVPLL